MNCKMCGKCPARKRSACPLLQLELRVVLNTDRTRSESRPPADSAQGKSARREQGRVARPGVT
jgi:hypothetical protein